MTKGIVWQQLQELLTFCTGRACTFHNLMTGYICIKCQVTSSDFKYYKNVLFHLIFVIQSVYVFLRAISCVSVRYPLQIGEMLFERRGGGHKKVSQRHSEVRPLQMRQQFSVLRPCPSTSSPCFYHQLIIFLITQNYFNFSLLLCHHKYVLF